MEPRREFRFLARVGRVVNLSTAHPSLRRTASGKTEFPWGGGSTAIGLSTTVDGGDERESVSVSGVWL